MFHNSFLLKYNWSKFVYNLDCTLYSFLEEEIDMLHLHAQTCGVFNDDGKLLLLLYILALRELIL